MNYISQLRNFYSSLDYKPLSSNAIAMYQFLLHMAYELNWQEQFKVSNNVFISKLGIKNLSSLQRCRNELIQQDYILYKKRSKSK